MSLANFREYCRTKADHPDTDPADAALWSQLADEIDTYLADTLDDDGEEVDLFT